MGLDIYLTKTKVPPEEFYKAYVLLRRKIDASAVLDREIRDYFLDKADNNLKLLSPGLYDDAALKDAYMPDDFDYASNRIAEELIAFNKLDSTGTFNGVSESGWNDALEFWRDFFSHADNLAKKLSAINESEWYKSKLAGAPMDRNDLKDYIAAEAKFDMAWTGKSFAAGMIDVHHASIGFMRNLSRRATTLFLQDEAANDPHGTCGGKTMFRLAEKVCEKMMIASETCRSFVRETGFKALASAPGGFECLDGTWLMPRKFDRPSVNMHLDSAVQCHLDYLLLGSSQYVRPADGAMIAKFVILEANEWQAAVDDLPFGKMEMPYWWTIDQAWQSRKLPVSIENRLRALFCKLALFLYETKYARPGTWFGNGIDEFGNYVPGSCEEIVAKALAGEGSDIANWRKDYTIVDAAQEIWEKTVKKYNLGETETRPDFYGESIKYPVALYLELSDGSFSAMKKKDIWENWTNVYLGIDSPESSQEAMATVKFKREQWKAAETWLKQSPENHVILVLSP